MKVNIPKGDRKSSKMQVQIDDWDTWGLDSTLALIILPALLQLKQDKHGVPSEFAAVGGSDSGNQQCFDFYNESYDEAFEIGAANWDDALNKMIWSFQQIVMDGHDSKYHHGEMEIEWREVEDTVYNPFTNKNEKLYEMVDKNPNEHWYDSVGALLHEEKIQEGLELFGKHFRSLWT